MASRAPSGCAISLTGPDGLARQARTVDQDVTFTRSAACAAQDPDQMIACRSTAGGWTGMPRLALPIDLARGDTGEADLGAFRAPDRAVAVPDARGSANEGGAGRHDGGEECKHQLGLEPTGGPLNSTMRCWISSQNATPSASPRSCCV